MEADIKKSSNLKISIFYSLSFLIPFFLFNFQIITGPIVNCFLIMGALKLRKREVLPLIFMPSIALLLGAVVFKSLFFSYLIPFIWISNFAFVFLFKFLKSKKMRDIRSLILATSTKVAILFLFSFFLYGMGVYPKIILLIMGAFQYFTALCGGIIAISLNKAIK